MNIREYVESKGITVTVDRDRGAQVEDGWEHHAYILSLHNASTGETWSGVPWKQGYGIETVPQDEPERVLDALVSDAAGYINARSFEEWADEYGYDTDSRRAEAIHRQCGEVAERLTALLGGRDELNRVAYDVERL